MNNFLEIGQKTFSFMDATQFTAFDTLVRVLVVILAATMLFLSLRIRDKIAGIKFKEVFEIIKRSPLALSIYFSTWVFIIGIITAVIFA